MIDSRVAAERLENIESEEEIHRAIGKVLGLLEVGRNLAEITSVVLKPNICWGEDWKTGGTFCPQLLRAFVRYLRDHDVDEIVLAEGTMVGTKTFEVLTKLGFMDMARELDLKVVDLNEDDMVEVKVPNHHVFDKIEVAKTVVESEYFINMPIMKTHINTLVTLSMKNLKGTIPQKWKKRLHYMGLDGGIADLASAVTPDLILIDGLVGQEGMGPLTGTPAYAKVLMASRDPLAIDVVASRAMGFESSEIKHLSMYASSHNIDLASFRPEVVGVPMSELDLDFERPHFALEGAYEGVEILWGDPCSGCAGALSVALERMERAGELDKIRKEGGMTVALGKDANPGDMARLILMGKCQHRNRKKGIYIPGCPPPGMIVRDIILKLADAESRYGGDAFIKEAEGLYEDEPE